MGVRSFFSQLNHPVVWTTVSALAVAGAIYYFKREKKDAKIEEHVAEDLDVIDDQVEEEVTMEDFSCIAVLGRGSFGKVLLGEYKKTQELFAIKAMKKRDLVTRDYVNELKRERKVLELVTRAHHPFLTNMFACFQTDLHTCFVLEYAAGGDLMTQSEQGPVSELRTLFYSACAVLGLEFLHSHNIAHRDIKLANMLLDAEGYLKIADFGYCKEDMGFKRYASSMAGTTSYLAPEIITEKMYTRAVDWWALGVCIYQMLVGELPFDGEDDMVICVKIISTPITFPSFLPKDAVQIIQELTRKTPWIRLGSGAKGVDTVKGHCFFKDIPWDDLLARKIEPPWVPTIKDSKDVSNFEDFFTVESPVLSLPLDLTSLTQEEQLLFQGLDWFSPRRDDKASGLESLVPG